MIPAILYSRHSPRPIKAGERERIAAQEDASSIQVQVDVAERYCLFHSFHIVEVLKEPFVSARSTPLFERPEGRKLMGLPRGHKIVALDLTRVFRDVVDGLTSLAYFEKSGVELHLASQGGCTLNCSTADGKLITTFLLGVASHEPMQTAERTSRGMKHRQKNGAAMTRPGYSPYGTTALPDGSLVPNPAEQAVADRIVLMHGYGMTFSNIATELNDAGVPRRKHGTKWDFAMVRSVVLRRTEA